MTREESIAILDGFKHNPLFNQQHFEALDMAIEALKEKIIPDTATNEDVMNDTLRRVFPKTIFIRSQSIANKTQAIHMSDEWLGRNYKEMYK
jgi:hypothetical protein